MLTTWFSSFILGSIFLFFSSVLENQENIDRRIAKILNDIEKNKDELANKK
jgi:hypothetical protein